MVAAPASADQAADGPLIAFTTDRDGDNEVYVVEVAGGTPVDLTQNHASDHSPTWSPDGGGWRSSPIAPATRTSG